MRVAANLVVFAIGLTALAAAHADEAFHYATSAVANEVVIDSRPLADCKRSSLPGARCLPAEDFLGPHRRLPSERDILWLLGTAGLDGSEAVLVVGQDATARDFVGGLLYLAGQRQVRVLTEPLARVLSGRTDASPGHERGIIRAAVFTAPMRAERVVLKQELNRLARSRRCDAARWPQRTGYWAKRCAARAAICRAPSCCLR
jgi:thiosulfate/3-mercaptopyruvate sulfurtransferase